jgi:hypothetical protein
MKSEQVKRRCSRSDDVGRASPGQWAGAVICCFCRACQQPPPCSARPYLGALVQQNAFARLDCLIAAKDTGVALDVDLF